MLTPILTPERRKLLERTWLNFETVVKTLPSSDITALLLFYSRGLLESLTKPSINVGYVRIITLRVNELINVSPMDLGIDDMLATLNEALDTCLTEQDLETPIANAMDVDK